MSRIRICLSLYGTTEEICAQVLAHPNVDLYEIRLDLGPTADPARIRHATAAPLLFASHTRPDLLPQAAAFADYLDIGPKTPTDSRHIVSIHASSGRPEDLWRQYSGNHITKIVLQTEEYETIRELLLLNRRDPGRSLCFAMGETGAFSRVLSGFFGAPWIYASTKGRPTAAGQFTINELTELYRLDRFEMPPQVFGIVGDPVAHSRSPFYHNSRFADENIPWLYLSFPCRDLGGLFRVAPDLGIRGFSITHPHKEAAAALLDEATEEVRALRACNTVLFDNGRVRGINTDVAGATAMLRSEGVAPEGSRMIILGAGSSARTVAAVARPLVRELRFLNRTPEKAQALAAEFQAKAGSLQDLATLDYDILFQTTPVGLREDECPVDPFAIRPGTVVLDAIYNPAETRLLRHASARGCRTLNGLPWFEAQAEAQLRWWRMYAAHGDR